MKLVALVVDVEQEINRNLIGSIVVVDRELTVSGDDELCYREIFHSRGCGTSLTSLLQYYTLKHSVSNIEILGVY